MDLALNNRQRLICRKTHTLQPTNQPTNRKLLEVFTKILATTITTTTTTTNDNYNYNDNNFLLYTGP